MASQATQSSSCVQLPVDSSPTHVTEIYMKDYVGEDNVHITLESSKRGLTRENGNIDKSDNLCSQAQTGKGFETFLMTGEMIIHTNPAVTQKPGIQDAEVKSTKASQIPRLGHSDQKQLQQYPKAAKPQPSVVSPKLHSKIPGPIKNHNALSSSPHQNRSPPPNSPHTTSMTGQARDFPLIKAPVAEVEELSDLSQSSCSESELGLENGSAAISPSLPVNYNLESPSTPSSASSSTLKQAMEALGKLQSTYPGNNTVGLSDTSFSEPLSSGDSGFVYDGHISDPDLADRGFLNSEHTLSIEDRFVSDETLTDKEIAVVGDNISSHGKQHGQSEGIYQTIISDGSGEKYVVHGGNSERLLVRTSKSHENYLQAGTGIALVSIDIDDSLAYSLDTLTYHDSPDSSMDNVASESIQTSRSLDNSPEKKSEKSLVIEREFIPGFISFEDSKPVKLKFNKQRDDSEEGRPDELNSIKNFRAEFMSSSPPSQRFQFVSQKNHDRASGDGLSGSTLDDSDDDSVRLRMMSEDADSDSVYHQPSKAVDKPSAERLAKRLFHLEGFRKSDVSRHLCKKNDFSNLVAEEYLKFFDFHDDTLDQALRKFLLKFSLYGETQERERVLAHFSRRFMECNDGSFNSEDACHTLTCAIMLLNSDLHAQNVGRRMTCQEFIENLAELNDGADFSKDVLRAIYQSIKTEPLEWAVDEVSPEQDGAQLQDQGQGLIAMPQVLGSNPFLEVPDPNKTTEYKKGYVMRKCCIDPDRRKTPLGKRGWKMLYAVLRDMILYQYKDEHQLKKDQFAQSNHNAVRIHHALATKASDYTKKQHVYRLQTADGAEYLFQTGDSKELQEWVDIINLVAASLSAPVLPGAVGSKAKFQRQLLPASYTRLNLREQLHSHETKVQELELDLHAHRSAAPEKGSRSSVIQEYLDKESYLEFEIKRFKTYVYLLQGKLMAFPELEPSLVETTIGEYEEMGAAPTRSSSSQSAMILTAAKSSSVARPVQRSISDRYSYRAAIYQTECVEYDMV